MPSDSQIGATLKHLALIEVFGLFKIFDHRIHLSDDPHATILSGPNGSGKTHTLRLVKAAFDLDLHHLSSTPYETLTLTFQKGEKLEITRVASRKGEVHGLVFHGKSAEGREYKPVEIPIEEIREQEQHIADSIEDTGRRFWHYYTTLALNDSPSMPSTPTHDHNSRAAKTTWIRNLLKTESVIIETKRLHSAPPGPISTASPSPKKRSILETHLDRIDRQVTEAREASLAISQERDQSFPMRILQEPGSTKVRAASMMRLKDMYNDVHAVSEELHSNGLSALPEFMEFPDRDLTTLERRILTHFVQDWRKKLSPLIPVSVRIQALRSILNGKLRLKKAQYHSTRGLEFVSDVTGEPIPVNSLSSGEQHLIVLFTSLLFSATRGSIVLIDEPEISMHAAWQHAFLGDISRVAKIQELQVILATHSTAIINGHWELVQEIGVE